MSRTKIAAALRLLITEQGKRRCGYCLTQQRIVGQPMEVDHIVPEAEGGLTEEANLWLACSSCNDHKNDRTTAPDPVTGERVPLFDPRRQVWADHFAWSEQKDVIVGLTPTGRATVAALNMNRTDIVGARQLWASAGWHPPAD